MPRLLIGVTVGVEEIRHGAWVEPAAILSRLYLDALQRAGATALVLAPDDALASSPGDVLDRIDGLLVSGGIDIDPLTYGAAPHPEVRTTAPERDRLEISLTHGALARDLPVLGICRGAQLLNVARGGTLHQHLPELVGHDAHRHTPGVFNDHDVRLEKGTLAARAAGERLHATKSHHHQGVDALGEGFVVTGRSTLDELPEAIERRERRFALGVQWHPEADETSRLIAALVEEARSGV